MADVADKLGKAGDPTSTAIETLKPFVFPAVTLLLGAGALFNAALSPFPFGAMMGLTVLVLLVGKFFLGKIVSKVPGADTLVDTEEKGMAERLKDLAGGGAKKAKAGGDAAKEALKKATKKAVSSAKSKAGGWGTLIILIIEYLITPMNQFEQMVLLFSLALFLPAASVQPGLVLGLVNYGCTAGGNTPDICSALPAGALDAAFKFLSK